MKIFSPILKGTTTVAQGTTNLSGSFTGSLFGTAATASYADNFTVGGTLTAQTINVQIITSSIEFNTGSTRNGALSTNTHQFTGSVLMSGSLGIGTSTPGVKLNTFINDDLSAIQIRAESNTSGIVSYTGIAPSILEYYRNTDTAVDLTIQTKINFTGSGGNIIFSPNSSTANLTPVERMRITKAGNVLIGRTTLTGGTGVLEVEQNSAGGYTVVVNSTNTIEPSIYLRSVGSATKSVINSNVDMSFRMGGAERMVINSLGFTKANNAGSYRSGASLEGHEFSDNSSNSFNHFSIYASSTSTQGTLLRVVSDRNTTNNTYNLIDAGGPSVDFIVRDSSNCVNTNGSYGAISDIRLKENIVDTSPKLEDLLKVKVRNYNLKSNPDLKQIGVIAQELEDIFPGMIEEALDDKTNEITKSVKYSVFVPMLIKAVQELSAENDTLKEILQRNNIQ